MWCIQRGWLIAEAKQAHVRVSLALKEMREQVISRDGRREWDTILDLGEGWGSIGIAAEGIEMATVGVDNAGILYQGTLHGHIRARIQMDFATQHKTNLLRRIMKKAGMRKGEVMAIWLSPECTLLSKANHMNKSRGCAHGPYTESPENLAAAAPERIEMERAKFEKCIRAVEEQMRALEEEDIPFALENPQGSLFWELEPVKRRIDLMYPRGWRTHLVDQCAYGRLAQKPTIILTNIKWTPRGLTRDGRCKVGICSGTIGNTPGTPGAGKHAQQTITNEMWRQTRMGEYSKGKRGLYSVEAAKNRVETMLVQEILISARTQKSRKRALAQMESGGIQATVQETECSSEED